MRELCPKHQLAIAPDGKCVLCRRPSLRVFGVRQEHETAISRVFTGLLGVCLLAASAALVYVSMLDPGYTGGRYVGGRPALAKLPTPEPEPAASPAPSRPGSAGEAAAAEAAAEAATEAAAEATAEATAEAATERVARDDRTLAPVAVTMYATPWCDICDRAREFLLARDAVLTEHDVDSDRAAARRLAELNPDATVPTFEVAGRAFVGFNPWDLEDAMRAPAHVPATAGATASARAPAPRTP